MVNLIGLLKRLLRFGRQNISDTESEIANNAREVLRDLHVGIDSGKRVVTATHDFEKKLLAIDVVFLHIDMEYGHLEMLHGHLRKFSEMIVSLRNKLEDLSEEELHIVLLEEAIENSSKKINSRGSRNLYLRYKNNFRFRYRKKVEGEILNELEVDKEILKDVHTVFLEVKKGFEEVKKIKLGDLVSGQEKKELEYILEKLMGFFVSYEKIFSDEIKRLEIVAKKLK